MRIAIATAASLSAAACAPLPANGELSSAREAPDPCNLEGGETFISQQVTAELGAQILIATGATSLRWVPPGMTVTTEYVYGRVSVHYDRDMRVTEVTCG